jgi:hypothetical protein
MSASKALFLWFTLSCVLLSCKVQPDKKAHVPEMGIKIQNVQVYYFHFTRRCETCIAIQNVTQKSISELYGDKVFFSDYNLDEVAGAEKGKDLGISGQTLLIISGNTKINITNEGFLYALGMPDKLKQVLKEKIDPIL